MEYNTPMDYDKLDSIQKNRLSLKLKPVFVGQLVIVESLQYPAFFYEDGEFKLILDADEGITSSFISEYAQKFSSEIFIFEQDFDFINSTLKQELTKLTRSLSIGDVKKNAIKHTNLLSMQMNNLYKDPFNDELLTNQFQNSKNLSNLLINNKDIHKSVYHSIANSKYHFTLTQPLQSSVLLLSFIQSLKLFNDKEIEALFLTSYFKDIGMSFIPREKFELAHLSEFDKNLFANHANNSMLLLDGRVPLNTTQLNLIKNHHYLNYKIQALVTNTEITQNEEFLTGVESAMLSSIDILIAMINPRPYRDSMSSFKALELLKKVVADEYPQEFKALVFFLKNFLSK
ncbi:MAG: HD-GYP domain-containing protein (c-di-GMP phosphodiesterase class II) [Bacteriovoracaceae bacterium]|jgi:HD-GYP domain-containing protein (c-di-GMP phosphodiesterase class II)